MPKIHDTFRPWDSWTRGESKETCSLVNGKERNFSYLLRLEKQVRFMREMIQVFLIWINEQNSWCRTRYSHIL
jgi:hypothetical protein